LPDIFLSYSRDDQATARRFAEGFAREGFSVWWDATLRSGEAYDQVTEKALREAKAVVVLWSRKSVASRWVRAEATLADRNRTLVPVMIELCDRPIMFELTQTADLAHWQGEADDKAWQALLSDIRGFLDRPSNPAQPVAPAASAPAGHYPDLPGPGQRGEAPSLAVMPFTNRSGLPQDEVFAFGMVEDVIDALSQGVNVRVLSSSATSRFRTGVVPDLDAIARQLGVRYILEGNVRRAGDNLRVTAQLVEAASGAILWTQKFDRPLTELASLQEALVLEVAAHLGVQVLRLETERALRKPADLTAWEAAMSAQEYTRRLMTVAHQTEAIEKAQRAVAIAPDYGLAHANLASILSSRYQLRGGSEDPDEVRGIREHADLALSLDPDNASVLALVSLALCFTGNPHEAARHAERAVRLSPGAGDPHHVCGIAHALLNRCDEALLHFDADLKATPGGVSNSLNLGWQGNVHLRAGRWAEAMVMFERSLALNADNPFALLSIAALFHRAGRASEARERLAHARRLDPHRSLAQWERGLGEFYKGSATREELYSHLRALWSETESTTT
jgi:TolB-like protein/Tfp pilus assembly protein PilF